MRKIQFSHAHSDCSSIDGQHPGAKLLELQETLFLKKATFPDSYKLEWMTALDKPGLYATPIVYYMQRACEANFQYRYLRKFRPLKIWCYTVVTI